ncbi:Cytochrome c-type heme lyase [Hondaea fermentalgiana]|uniref:Holocytochrome c-type synthase n=1 Tax=Hondaea fermentalgiana TaxID=2315210 RepID=A0A2R5GNK2_9STRA|nr:Cytochrome c-type heme lyase [Hondaea fermentalgiana]|eukprot:GBG32467.1 Cytochrome c-type heme lyase [Hondaea fermentalgiana]
MAGCPVDHGQGRGPDAEAGVCPVPAESRAREAFVQAAAEAKAKEEEAAAAAGQAASGGAREGKVELDERNYMPKTAEQKAWPGQRFPLSTNRVESVIPKGEFSPDHQKHSRESSSWMYPSEQQFFNAMKRKGWKPREEDMRIVLAIHNHVNDKAWSEVSKYESMHPECDCPKLVRFMGKPKNLSPKATVRSWFGYAKPFDRHDWIVDRCGTEVRYVIDFYQGAQTSNPGEVVSMYLDARPALDSWGSVVDRARMQFREVFKAPLQALSSATSSSSPSTPSTASGPGASSSAPAAPSAGTQ